eukprot:scaffold295471_cov32-Prasinocladus_malaysianus.AAC.1
MAVSSATKQAPVFNLLLGSLSMQQRIAGLTCKMLLAQGKNPVRRAKGGSFAYYADRVLL